MKKAKRQSFFGHDHESQTLFSSVLFGERPLFLNQPFAEKFDILFAVGSQFTSTSENSLWHFSLYPQSSLF
jgi:hypothetical protein